jgi:hypothetical protein
MRVWAISGDKEYWRISDNPSEKVWYTRTEEVREVLETINKGDDVTITWKSGENGKRLLTSVVKNQNKNTFKQENGNKFRSVEELRKDETMRSACKAVSTMVGQFQTVDQLGEAICKLYDKLWRKIR